MPLLGIMDGNDETAARETKPKSFARLVEELSEALIPFSGGSFEELDPDGVVDLMKDYKSNEPEWEQYAFEDPNKTFTRNLIDKGNGKSNLVLRGSLIETRYDWPNKSGVTKGLVQKEDGILRLEKDETAYISDRHGLHKISTPEDSAEFAVSLHRKYRSPKFLDLG
ncbi:cysteine dioxygenase [Physcia stellaris]|nr:cysteine dioxygenase [Physcia stellaris]